MPPPCPPPQAGEGIFSPTRKRGREYFHLPARGEGTNYLLRDAIFVPTPLIFLRRSAAARTSTASPHRRIQGVLSSVPVTVTDLLTEPFGPSPSSRDGSQMDSRTRAAAGEKSRRRTSTGSA